MNCYNSRIIRRRLLGCLAVGFLQLVAQARPAVAADTQLTRAQKEEFLLKAKVVKAQGAAKGITDTQRATLTDGTLTHDASIQTIDDFQQKADLPSGTEFNFKDSWKFNLAAYKLDRLLGLNMIPATVERRYNGRSGSFTWWVDDVIMDEGERAKKKAEAPDTTKWNDQMYIVRVFDQLIFNTDRNLGNLLIDKNWQAWMIDHSRTFRILPNLREPKNLERCDRDLLERLKQLNTETLTKELGKYLTGSEIKGLLARRDKIVKAFADKGPSALYDSPRRPD
jgi:hypothetical protein